MLRKTSAAAAVSAFATIGSTLFGGAALAHATDSGEPGDTGGNTYECYNVVDLHEPTPDDRNIVQTCTVTANDEAAAVD
jgi:hypothetical protein